jgi:Na+/proline symporter
VLLTGGSAVVESLTGVPTAAACFLLPVGVVLYTMFGGIKATFLTDYAHTVVILVILLTFAFTAYSTNEVLGSPGKVFDLLQEAAKRHPVEGNQDGMQIWTLFSPSLLISEVWPKRENTFCRLSVLSVVDSEGATSFFGSGLRKDKKQ